MAIRQIVAGLSIRYTQHVCETCAFALSETETLMLRRDFLKAGIGGAASLALLQQRVFAAGNDAPLRVGLIGCGWYGKTDLFHLIQVAPVDVVGLVRRRQSHGGQGGRAGCTAATVQEAAANLWRLSQIAFRTAPGNRAHRHARSLALPADGRGVQSGADVYCQKPISYDVVEGQAMVAAARKYNRTVQVGLQRRSTPHLLEARDKFVRSGKLGKIAHVEIHSYYGSRREFPASTAPPEHLDWDTYVGPAAWRDFNSAIHPRAWRDCREFSNGQTGDLCVHFFDFVRYALDLGWPRTISASGGILMRDKSSNVNTHDTQTAVFDYGDLQVVWNQRNWGPNPDPQYPWGATLYGDKGMLKVSVQSYDFIPHGGGTPVHGDFVDEQRKISRRI